MENFRPVIPDSLLPVEVQRYGRANGSADYLFGEIHAFAVGTSGEVYVHDSGEGVRVYEADGSFRGRLARAGQGPGEVGYAVGMETSGGSVAALDLQNRRISVLRQSEDPWSTPMPEGRPPYRDGALVFTDEGHLYVGYNPMYPETGGIRHPRPVFIRVLETGGLGDTIFTPAWIVRDCPELSSYQHGRGFWEDNREPYIPKVKWALGPDGTLGVGCPSTYTFYLLDPDGAVTRVSRDRPEVRMSDEEQSFRAAMPVPRGGELLPAYAKIRLVGDGRIWVWPTQPSVRVPVAPEVAGQFGVTHTWSIAWQGAFDVFDESGRWVAVVRLPPQARYSGFPTEPGVVIRGDTLWAVEQDAYDVQTIVRYVVSGLSGGS